MYLETRFRARMRGNSGAPSDSLPKPTPANGIVLFTVYCSGSRVRTPSTTRLVGSPTHGGFSLPHSALVLRALSDILPSFAHLFPSRFTSLVETSDGRYSHHRVAVIQGHFLRVRSSKKIERRRFLRFHGSSDTTGVIAQQSDRTRAQIPIVETQ